MQIFWHVIEHKVPFWAHKVHFYEKKGGSLWNKSSKLRVSLFG